MSATGDRWSLAIGLIASLALHALLIPSFLAVISTEQKAAGAPARFEPEDVTKREPEEPEEREELELGLETDTASTLTWIGYEEYEKHLARLAEVEQAAFTDDPAGGTPIAAPPSDRRPIPPSPVQPMTEPAASAPEQPERAQPAAVPDPAEEAPAEPKLPDSLDAPLPIDLAKAVQSLLNAAGQSGPAAPVSEEAPPTTTEREPSPGEATESPNQPSPQPQPPDSAEQEAQEKPNEDSPEKKDDPTEDAPKEKTEPTKEDPKDDPAGKDAPPAKDPSDAPPAEGEQADKDSIPTSTIEVPLADLDPGKPLAREGLELRPQRPRFTTLVELTASPVNPIVEIRFLSSGRPQVARIVLSSGDSRIDRAVEASLYRWRAAGEKLDELKEGQTLNIRIEIILNPRAKRR